MSDLPGLRRAGAELGAESAAVGDLGRSEQPVAQWLQVVRLAGAQRTQPWGMGEADEGEAGGGWWLGASFEV